MISWSNGFWFPRQVWVLCYKLLHSRVSFACNINVIIFTISFWCLTVQCSPRVSIFRRVGLLTWFLHFFKLISSICLIVHTDLVHIRSNVFWVHLPVVKPYINKKESTVPIRTLFYLHFLCVLVIYGSFIIVQSHPPLHFLTQYLWRNHWYWQVNPPA